MMTNAPDIDQAASGLAALSICESLLLALGDLKLISEAEVLAIVSDATEAHRNALGSSADMALHKSVVSILDRIVAGGNSIRRR